MSSTGAGTAGQKVSCQLSELAEKFIAERTAAGRSPLTLDMYRRTFVELQKHSGMQDIRMINRETIRSFVDQILRRDGWGRNEKAYWIARLKIFFGWVADQGLILADPAAQLKHSAAKRRNHPPYLRQDEVARILESIATETPAGLRDRALLELMYSSGLRTAEVCRLTVKDINFAEGTISVLMGKGNKDRMVPVGKIALHYLDLYISDRGLRPGPLFELEGWMLRRIVTRRARAAGIRKRCLPRTFRHSFAIHLLENGASIRHIQAMLGHSDLRTTQKYTNVVPQELKRAHAASHPAVYRRRKLPAPKPKRMHMSYNRS